MILTFICLIIELQKVMFARYQTVESCEASSHCRRRPSSDPSENELHSHEDMYGLRETEKSSKRLCKKSSLLHLAEGTRQFCLNVLEEVRHQLGGLHSRAITTSEDHTVGLSKIIEKRRFI